ncbi:hypothetical protein AB0903_00325 [Streptomyces sp. NPDC048389]|uniref:hypothetical protein n=1 Tax=Streptomyces sp. NPDC048389 TaxID=3154622 RepID=UPI003456BFDA
MTFTAALIVLGGAALLMSVAGRLPADRGLRWRFPVVTVLIAAADAGLAVTAMARPGREVGLVALLAAALLVYGTYRRLRAVRSV